MSRVVKQVHGDDREHQRYVSNTRIAVVAYVPIFGSAKRHNDATMRTPAQLDAYNQHH